MASDSTLNLIIKLQSDAEAGLKELRGQLEGVGGASGPAIAGFTLLGNAAYDAAQGVAAAIGGSIAAAGDFESAVNNLAAISGDALAQAGFAFADVEAKALALGSSTAFSASQSIAAMTELVKGGVPVADVMDAATEATLNLAAAGQVELANAAEIVAKQLGVWGDQGVTAAQVSDLLTQAANASTVGVEDLAAGLANAQGTAETAGVEYQDLIQTMALLAPNFASASTAGTSLNNFLLRIQPTTAPAIDAMRDLGLLSFNTSDALAYLAEQGIEPAGTSAEALADQLGVLAVQQGMTSEQAAKFVQSFDTSVFYDAEGAFVGMEQAASLLQGSLAGLSEAEKTAALQTIFGNDAMGAAVALAGAGADGFNAMGEAMAGAGTAADVAAVQNQGFNFALDSMKGSIETLQIIIGSALLPVLTALLDNVITPGINVVSTFAQAIMGSEEALGQLSAPAQAAVGALQQISATIGEVSAAVMAGDFGALGEVFANLFAGLGEGGDASPVQGLIDGIIGGLVNAVPQVLAAAAPIAAAVGQGLLDAAPAAIAGVGLLLSGVIGAIGAAIPEIIAAVQPYALAFAQWAVEAAPGLLANLGGLVAQLLGAVGAALPGIVEAVAGWAAAFIAFAIEAAPGVLANLLVLVGQVLGWVAAQVPGIAAQLGTWALAFLAWVGPTAADLVVALGQMVGLLLGALGAALPEIVNTMVTWADALVEWVLTTALPGALGALGTFVGDVLAFIGGQVGAMVSAAASIGKGVVDGIKQGFQNAWDGVKNWLAQQVAQIPAPIRQALGISSPSRVMAELVGQPVAQGIALGFTQALPDALRVIGDAGPALAKAAGDAPAEMEDAGADVVAGLVAGLEAGLAAVEAAAQRLVDAALQATQAAAAIASPSRLFNEEVGQQITAGMAEGMLANLQVLLDAAGEISWAVLEEAQAFAGTIQDALGPLLADAYQGAADFARGQIGALDLIDQLTPTNAEVDRMVKEIERAQKAIDEAWGKVTKNDDRIAEAERERARLEAALAGGGDLLDPREAARFQQRRASLEARRDAPGISDARRDDLQRQLDELEAEEQRARDTARDRLQDQLADTNDTLTSLREERARAEAAFEAERAGLEANRQYWRERAMAAQEVQAAQQRIADEAQAQLIAAQQQANALEDPAERARYLQIATRQIGEEARLRQQIAAATNDAERARLEERLALLRTAQQNELGLYATQARERATEQAAALRDAEDAIRQLGNLVYFSQEDVYGAGADAIRGIAQGMLAQAGMLQTTLGGILEAAIRAAQQRLGIASPSKVAGRELGLPFVQGIAAEVLKGRAALAGAAATAVGGLLVPPPALAWQPQTLLPAPAGAAGLAGAGAGGVDNLLNLSVNVTLPAGATPGAELRAFVEGAVRKGVADGLREAGRTAQVRRRMD